MFHMVVHWHKLGEVENECTLHNFVVLASTCQKLFKLVKIWQSYDKNNFGCFLLRHGVEYWYFWLCMCACAQLMEYKNKTHEAQLDLQKQLQAAKKVCWPILFRDTKWMYSVFIPLPSLGIAGCIVSLCRLFECISMAMAISNLFLVSIFVIRTTLASGCLHSNLNKKYRLQTAWMQNGKTS